MSIRLALADAANNCAQEGATAVLTLRSGIQHEGMLNKVEVDTGTEQIETLNGWITIDRDEIASVESRSQAKF